MDLRKPHPLQALLLVMVAVAWLSAGCATATKPANVQEVQCAAKHIAWEVCPEAQIQSFACELGTHELEPSLIFSVALKNVANEPLRYRVQIFLEDMDKAISYLVPIKGKPPAVDPGAVEKVKIPFMKTSELSKKILVVVKTAG